MPADTTTPPTDHIPADLLGGLLDGWVGPVVALHHAIPHESLPAEWIPTAYLGDGRAVGVCGDAERWSPRDLRLPLTRPEARWQVARVLAAGERCEFCAGHGNIKAHWLPPKEQGKPCPTCNGTGYLRKPAPIWWALTVADGGSLPNERAAWSPALIACSARRVAAGLGVVTDVLGAWRGQWHRGYGVRESSQSTDTYVHLGPSGWTLVVAGQGVASGPETGAPGKSAADAAALAAGFALANDDGTLVLPWPEGVRDAL